MKIVVCSKNSAKNDAVKFVMKDFFEDLDFVSLETNSMVSSTPLSDDEGILGCLNRIKDAINQIDSGDLYVAMEGIISKNDYGNFLCGWTVIYDSKYNEYYYGCSSKIRIPDNIINKLSKDDRLSTIVASYYGSSDDEVSRIGTNGILTNGVYTRTDEFIDSILCAISCKYKK